MSFSRVTVCIVGLTLMFPIGLFAQNLYISEKTEAKIKAQQDAKTLASILVPHKPATSTVNVAFKTTGCPASKLKDDSMYFLQIINEVGTVPSTYVPKDLVNITPVLKTWGKTPICMTRTTATQLYTMMKDMEKEKLNLAVVSAYRSYAEQNSMYKTGAKTLNSGSFDRVAPAGRSEHQLGTAMDISTLTVSGTSFGTTSESLWLQDNAHKYGFIISYGDEAKEKTGYMYEPWHIRYVGVDNATLLHEGQYTLSYKSTYYQPMWMQTLLGKLKEYVSVEI